MYKLIFALTSMFFAFSACNQGGEQHKIEHKQMRIPLQSRLLGIQCDRPCALFFDYQMKAYVMQYFDGSTYTVLPSDATE